MATERKKAAPTITPEQALALAGGAGLGRPPGPTRVVILGGGFAGVYAAKYLTALLGGRTDVQVELLSEENCFVFQPLLPRWRPAASRLPTS